MPIVKTVTTTATCDVCGKPAQYKAYCAVVALSDDAKGGPRRPRGSKTALYLCAEHRGTARVVAGDE